MQEPLACQSVYASETSQGHLKQQQLYSDQSLMQLRPRLLSFRLVTSLSFTIGTRIFADPETCFQELISEILLDRPLPGINHRFQ